MVDFRGQRRSNDTHASTTDTEAKLARKSKDAYLVGAAYNLLRMSRLCPSTG